MALDILAQNITIDETTGDQKDDSSVSNTTVTYLLSLDSAGGLTPPEVAFKQNFVVASASAGETITTVVLSQNLNGTPFSTTVGVNSGIKTVDGNYVWLFQDATHPNVVIGVIGTSDPAAEPAETGPLAYSFALINTSNTNADLYTVQYVPLLHPDATNPDDQIDLTNKVFASVTGTSTNNFLGQNAAPGNHDFYVINSSNDATKQLLVTGFSGANNATANVSTQGFGVANQSINPTETLQTDFVTGGNLPAGSASQIQYGSHLDGVMQAGFTINQITPSNPNLRVDIKITALDVTGNEQGLNFYDGSPTTAAPITSLKLTGTDGFASPIIADGSYNTASGDAITVSGLGTNVVTIRGLDNITTVDITTSSQMDRLLVTGVDSNEGLDITEFHFSATTPNAHTEEVGSFINFDDDGPAVTAGGTVPTLVTDDTDITDTATQSFAGVFTHAFGNDGPLDANHDGIEDAGAFTYALGVKSAGVDSGLDDTLTGDNILLRLNGTVVEGYLANATSVLAFTIAVDASGNVTQTQLRSVVHNDPADSVESGASAATLAADLVTLTATAKDGDSDTNSAPANIGQAFTFEDDGPTITVPPEALTLDNTQPAPAATANFGYDIGSDLRTYPGATAFTSDFVDSNGSLSGTQLALTGWVGDSQNLIKNTDVTLQTESASSAVFDFTFQYDADPNVAGDQLAIANGTLTFNKVAPGTYTVALDAPIEGFSLEVLQTSELLAKNPVGNTGHPEIVVEKLATDFFVQFTADNTPLSFSTTGDTSNTGDTVFTGADHDMAGGVETWVSATQSTNGVAGDTIQKNELLTLRFFGEDILSDASPPTDEKTNPTTTVNGLVVKFDGIGKSEDLVVILDLKDDQGTADTTDDVEITKAIVVENGDLYKKSTGVPSPYDTRFSLDNNDGLLIIESNDYNTATEHYEIQGVQIMQSANGLTGTGIDLNAAVGATGGSTDTQSITSGNTNDVLKITDIGFVRAETFPQDASLDFSFQIVDGDGDTTTTQQLHVDVLNA
jgi:Domain of unknown function (DUF5801)